MTSPKSLDATNDNDAFDVNAHNAQYLSQLHQTENGLTALIFGASGLVGKHCVDSLLADTRYDNVIIIVRKKLDIAHEKLLQIASDFQQLPALEQKVDHVFCCLGTTIKKAGSKQAFRAVDYSLIKKVAEYSQQQEISFFGLVSAVDASPHSRFFYNKVKGETEFALSELAFKSLAIFRPSIIVGQRLEFRLLEALSMKVMQLFSFAFVSKLQPYKPTKAEDIALAMIAVANLPKVASLQNIRFPNPNIKAEHLTFYNSAQIAKLSQSAVSATRVC